MERIIIDTDIGTDFDDAAAIALACKSNDLIIEGITTVYGDLNTRGRIVTKILKHLNRSDVNIYEGSSNVLLRNREIWWLGHEENGLTDADTYDKNTVDAVTFMINSVLNNPNEITIVAIGPLTNIALAIALEPRFESLVKQIIVMAGSARLGQNARDLEYMDHNVSRDPESAALVFKSSANIVMCGYDVTRDFLIGRHYIEQFALERSEIGDYLGQCLESWFLYWRRDFTAINDALCVLLVTHPDLCQYEKMNVHVEYDHRHPTGHTICVRASTPWDPPELLGTEINTPNIKVCISLDVDAAIALFEERFFS